MRHCITPGAIGAMVAAVFVVAATAVAQDDGLDKEARSLFEAGRVAYEEGRYDNALEYFRRAHELSGKPLLLYNMGASADRLRQDRRALEYFRAYLEQLPDAPNRAEVEARIEVLEGVVSGEQPDPESDGERRTVPGAGVAPGGTRRGGTGPGGAAGDGQGGAAGDGQGQPPAAPSGGPGQQPTDGAGAVGTPGTGPGQAPPPRREQPSWMRAPPPGQPAQGSQRPSEPAEGAERARRVRLMFLAYVGAFGRWNAENTGFGGDTVTTTGFELRLGFPFAKYLGMGVMVRPAVFWNTEGDDGMGVGRSYFLDLGPHLWGGYPFTIGAGYLMPFAGMSVGPTVSVLSGDLSLADDVATGWHISAYAGVEFLIGRRFAILTNLGWAQHRAEHGGIDIRTREMLFNIGIGIVF